MLAIISILIAILLTVFFAIRPVSLKKYEINIVTGSLILVVLLYICGFITNTAILDGLRGYTRLRPWEILIIFYSVAYVSVRVDLSGLLEYLAFKIIYKANGNGIFLFVFFYIFSSVLTIFTSNDIVILTMTPIIFYLQKHAKINIIPLLFAEFYGANTLSMLLYIGNPTNIIIGNSVGLTFLEYSNVMFLPTLTAAILNFCFLFIIFRKNMTKKYHLDNEKEYKIKSKFDLIINTSLLLLMLITLLLSESLKMNIWQITLAFAILMVIEDILLMKKNTKEASSASSTIYASNKSNNFLIVISRLPWKILPFIISIFIFISALVEKGFIDFITIKLTSLTQSLGGSIVLFGFSSLLLSNVINNQPMSIFFSNILVNSHNQLNTTLQEGAIYAVIIASNLGANLTLIGALAGIMWERILHLKEVKINYIDFLKIGLKITPLVFILTLLVLLIRLS